MSLSFDTVKIAFERTGGMCECIREEHKHLFNQCGRPLVWLNRGRIGIGSWDANCRDKKQAEAEDVVVNCEILCWTCHRATLVPAPQPE